MEIPVKTCFLLLILVSVVYGTLGEPGPGLPLYDDCVEAHQKTCNGSGGIYFIKSRNSVGYEETECHSAGEAIPETDCTGSGWTFIGQLSGNPNTNETSYDSAIWTAKGENQIQFNSQFWSANVTEVCLTSTGFGIQLPVKGPSLRSLFFENITLEIPTQQWIDGIKIDVSNLNFTNACFKSGFNVGDPNFVRARLGVVSVFPHTGCSLSVKAIGVGIKVAGKDYGSVHGLYANTNNAISDVSYHDVTVYVRSRPDPSETVPTMMMP